MEQEKKENIRDILASAEEDFRDRVKNENVDLDEPHDVIFEIADSHVPIYNADLLDVAADDNGIALDTPEIGPAFDGSPTPINIIAANIFERIEQHLFEVAQEMKQEAEEAEAV